MATLTGKLGNPDVYQSTVRPASAPVSLGVTMPAGKCPYGAVSFPDIAPSSGGSWGNYWIQTNDAYSGNTYTWRMYLCDSAGNNAVPVMDVTINGSSSYTGTNTTQKTGSCERATGLAGKAIYLKAALIGAYDPTPANTTFCFRGVTDAVITYSDAAYSISVSAGTGGTLSANKNSAAPGETVTLTPSANTGYQLSSYTKTPSSLSISNNKFTMPSQAVTVKANFSKINYTVTASAGTGGSLTASKSTANYGDTVTLTPTANTGYQLSSYTKTPSSLSISNNKFTMPSQAVTVKANFSKINYTVTASAGTGGSLTASKSTANYGDKVTLTPTANTGYQFSGYTTSPTVTITNNSFTMPAGNITITASFTKISYSVTVSAGTGGSLSANKSTAHYGDSVTLTPTPNTGYQFSSYTKTPSSLVITNNAFTMPASNVSVTASFSKVNYTVTVSAGTGGTLTANKSTAQYGDTVTLTPTPSTGYKFSGYTTSPSVTVSNNKFSMPASNITITASFTKITYTISKTVSPSGAGTVTTSANSAVMGTTVTVSQTPATGYYFNGWTTSPANLISSGSFTMPASNVSITAKYLKRSTATLNKTTLEGGGSCVLTITTESAAYSHKYKLSFGTNMETSLTTVAAGTTSVTISVPLNWSAQIPSATSKSGGTLKLETYNGSTKIGEYTISSLTYSVPASVKPTMGSISTSRTTGGIGSYYVQGHSGVSISGSASGQQSATITSLSIAISGYSGSSYNKTVSNTGSISLSSGLLTIAGSTKITVTATDSRGRTNSTSTTITVQAYSAPAGTLRVWRVDNAGTADDMGEYGKYELTKSYSMSSKGNTLSWSLSVSGSSKSSPGDTGDLLPGNRKQFNQNNEYTVTLTLTDALETTTITAKLPSARFIIYVDSSGNKLGFMKVANKTIPSGKSRTVEFSSDTQIYIGDMTLEDYIRSIT